MSTLERLRNGTFTLRAPETESGAGTAVTPVPTLDEIVAPATGAPAAAPSPAPSASPAPSPASSSENMVPQSRVDELTAERYEARRRAEAAERRAQELAAQLDALAAVGATTQSAQSTPAPTPSPSPSARTYTQEELNREAQILARQQAQQMAFQTTLDNAVIEGRSSHGDFDNALSSLTRGGPLPMPVLHAIVANSSEGVAKASEVIYALGKDLAEADRIFSLPPDRQGIALTRFALKVAGQQGTPAGSAAPLASVGSRAPAPIKSPVSAASNATGGDLYDENISPDDWFRIRQAQRRGQAA